MALTLEVTLTLLMKCLWKHISLKVVWKSTMKLTDWKAILMTWAAFRRARFVELLKWQKKWHFRPILKLKSEGEVGGLPIEAYHIHARSSHIQSGLNLKLCWWWYEKQGQNREFSVFLLQIIFKNHMKAESKRIDITKVKDKEIANLTQPNQLCKW